MIYICFCTELLQMAGNSRDILVCTRQMAGNSRDIFFSFCTLKRQMAGNSRDIFFFCTWQ